MIDSFYHRRVFFSLSVFTGPVQFLKEFFSYIRLAASYIASQFYCALHSVIRFASLLANII